jgi:hypothetical protein
MLLNYHDDFPQIFQQTGIMKSCEEIDAWIGASEIIYSDLVLEASSNRVNNRFDERMDDSQKKNFIDPKLSIYRGEKKFHRSKTFYLPWR